MSLEVKICLPFPIDFACTPFHSAQREVCVAVFALSVLAAATGNHASYFRLIGAYPAVIGWLANARSQ